MDKYFLITITFLVSDKKNPILTECTMRIYDARISIWVSLIGASHNMFRIHSCADIYSFCLYVFPKVEVETENEIFLIFI